MTMPIELAPDQFIVTQQVLDDHYRSGKKTMAVAVMRTGSQPKATLADVLAVVAALYDDGKDDTNVTALADNELATVSAKVAARGD